MKFAHILVIAGLVLVITGLLTGLLGLVIVGTLAVAVSIIPA